MSAAALPASADREPRIRAVRAKADAFVTRANRDENYGRARVLRVDASPVVRTYLRFDVNVHSGDVRHVSLLLYSRTRSRAGCRVRIVEESWRERQITFLNAPTLSPEFVSTGRLKGRAWEAIDVTPLIEDMGSSGDERSISLALTATSPIGLEFASRETGLHGPRLIVEREGKGKSTSSTTTTATTAVEEP